MAQILMICGDCLKDFWAGCDCDDETTTDDEIEGRDN